MGSRFRLLAEGMPNRRILGEQGNVAYQKKHRLVFPFSVAFGVAVIINLYAKGSSVIRILCTDVCPLFRHYRCFDVILENQSYFVC